MDKSKQISHQAADSDITPAKFWGNIVLNVLIILASIVLLRNILQAPETMISHAVIAVQASSIFAGLTVILLTIRGQQKLGAQIAFYTTIVLLVSGPLFYAGRALTTSFSLLVISAVTISELLPKESRRRSIVIAGVAFMSIWLLEWLNPSWRLTTAVSNVGWASSIVFALILSAVVIRQSWYRIISSIRIKIMLWSGISLFLSAALIIGYAVFAYRTAADRAAEGKALDVAHTQAAEIRTVLERTLTAGETFTQSVIVVKTEGVQMSRGQVNAMLRQVLKDNPQFVGVDVLFEPNAFDGKDAEFINTEGSNANGRFLPYWTRGEGGRIQVELLQDYDTSDWYQCPKTTKVPCLVDPYIYPVQGRDVWMTSLVIPFVYEDEFLGITGIDTPITFLQELADQADVFDGAGKIVLLSNNGTLLGVTGQPELIGQPVTAFHDHFSVEDYQAVKEGAEIIRYGLEQGGQLEVFVPIQVGDTAAPWSVNVIVPQAAILADATKQMWRMIAISAVLLLASLAVLFYAAHKIAQPIRKVTDVALQVADGNLNVQAEIQSSDETGILASAFNRMTKQLRTAFTTLEERVADRTKDLATVAEVGTATASILESGRLLQEVVDLTKERFHLYHAHIYLMDEAGENLVLTAGAGEPGRIMVAERRSIPLDREQSLVARAARERKGVTVNDVTQAPDFLPNPLLPNTRSELAVPMIVGGNLIGVFDIQSEQVGRFTESDIHIQTTLASLVGTSIQNVRTFERSQKQAELASLINTIGQKIQRATSIEETLQVGIRELGLALGAPEVSANISRREDSGSLIDHN